MYTPTWIDLLVPLLIAVAVVVLIETIAALDSAWKRRQARKWELAKAVRDIASLGKRVELLLGNTRENYQTIKDHEKDIEQVNEQVNFIHGARYSIEDSLIKLRQDIHVLQCTKHSYKILRVVKRKNLDGLWTPNDVKLPTKDWQVTLECAHCTDRKVVTFNELTKTQQDAVKAWR